MSSQETYYDRLGISRLATPDEIKHAYRQLAKQYHPDASSADDATRVFQEVQQAYETLNNPRSRALYDTQLEQTALEAQPSALRVSVTLSHPVLQAMPDPQMLYALVEIGATEGFAVERPALNLCLALDNSLSMDGPRLQQAREAALYLMEHLQANDTLSVIVFSDRARLILEGPLGLERARAQATIAAIHPDGGTELLQGITLGLETLRRWHRASTLDRLMVLTDGQTYGDEAGCLAAADAAAQDRIGMTLLGLGADWNDKLLDEMAARSSGVSAFIDSPAKLVATFQQHFRELSDVFAPNLSLECHLSKLAQVQSVYRIAPAITQLSLLDTRLSLGTLEKSRPIRLLFELIVRAPGAPGDARLMHLEARGELITEAGNPQVCAANVAIRFSAAGNPQWQVTGEMASILARIAAFKVQEKAIVEVEKGDYPRATSRLKALATHLLNFGEADLARVALLEAEGLARTGHLSAEGRKRIRYGTRGLSRTMRLAEDDA